MWRQRLYAFVLVLTLVVASNCEATVVVPDPVALDEWVIEPSVETLTAGACGPLTFDAPMRSKDPSASVLRASRRVDMRLRVQDEELCIIGMRVFDTYAEIVAGGRGSAGTHAPWEIASLRWQIEPVRATTDTGVRTERGYFRPLPGGARSLPLWYGSEVDVLARLESAQSITMTIPLPSAVSGEWVFTGIPIKAGQVDHSANARGIGVRVQDVWFPSDTDMILGYTLETTDQHDYLPRLEWASAYDDVGMQYEVRYYGPPTPPRKMHYVALQPATGAPARDHFITVRAARVFVATQRSWTLTVPLR